MDYSTDLVFLYIFFVKYCKKHYLAIFHIQKRFPALKKGTSQNLEFNRQIC